MYCANSIGILLRKPLFNLTSNAAISIAEIADNQVNRVAKAAFHCFMMAIFIIPAGMLWLTGKAICCLTTQINHEGLYLAPPSIQLPEEDPTIDIDGIYNQYLSLKIEESTSSNRTSRSDSLKRLCNWIKTKHEDIYPDNPRKREYFCKQVSIYLQGILKKITTDQIDGDKKRSVLIEIAKASEKCWPSWLEESFKQYADVHDQNETAGIKLLRLVQCYKESLILEFSQQDVGAEWHALTFVRNILGDELGLNTISNRYDPYGAESDATFNKSLTKWLFLQKYEDMRRLVQAIKTRIEMKGYDSSYYDFLIEIVSSSQKNPEDYVQENFYNSEYKLNDSAIILMLKTIGILK